MSISAWVAVIVLVLVMAVLAKFLQDDYGDDE